mmetsp:Transcript_4018/g.9575  ORF Transcript_4018/g.9575 Transcript_4018/m.9575 type:complete len:315 (-) Transcript_4018:133-1077(-)
MSGNPVFDFISSAAVSLTMAGNTGISPFLTLFLLGVIEMAKPELLNMGPTMELILASWWSVGVLGVLTIAEMVGKCIPAVDEVIDSAEVFVVPAISIFATLATMGMFPVPEGSQADVGLGQNIDVAGIFAGGGEGGNRYLQDELDPYQDENTFSEGFMTFTTIILVGIGMGLALAIHLFKMFIRVSSLMCSGGCCQPGITIMEYVVVVFGVILAILAPVVAIVASIAFMVAAGYIIRKKCCKNNKDNESNGKDVTIDNDRIDDVEKQSTLKAGKADSVTNNTNPPEDAFAIAGFEDISLAPPTVQKLDVDAKTY